MTRFIFPVGDWSGDGHSRQTEYVLECNCSLQELREIYFNTVTRLGYGLDSNSNGPCSEYGEYSITKENLEELDLDLTNIELEYDEDEECYYLTPDDFVYIFIEWMKKHNKNLQLNNITENEELAMFPFYGYDEKKRHIGCFGYGLFD